KTELVADRGDDDVLHVRLADGFLQRRGEVLEHHDAFRAGVFQLVLQLACGVKRIDIDDGQAGAQRTEQRDRVLQQVRQHDRKVVTLAELPLVREERRERGALVIKLRPRERDAETRIRRALRMARAGLLEHRDNRWEGVDVDFGRYTRRIVRQPWTWVGHARSLL